MTRYIPFDTNLETRAALLTDSGSRWLKMSSSSSCVLSTLSMGVTVTVCITCLLLKAEFSIYSKNVN